MTLDIAKDIAKKPATDDSPVSKAFTLALVFQTI